MPPIRLSKLLVLFFILCTGTFNAYAQNNFRLRYNASIIDTTKDVHARLGLMSSTLLQAGTEDSLYMCKLFTEYRKLFLETYPGTESSLDALLTVLDHYAGKRQEEAVSGIDSTCLKIARNNSGADVYMNYFRLVIRNELHDEIQHPTLDSIYFTCLESAKKQKLDYLVALIYVARATYLSSHENKPDYFNQRDVKFAMLDTAVLFADIAGSLPLKTRILAAHARYAASEGKFKRAEEYGLKAMPLATKCKDSSSLYITYNVISTVNLQMKNYKEAEHYALLNYDLAKQLNDYPRLASTSGRLMDLYRQEGDTANALMYGRIAVSNSRKSGNRYNSALTLGNYGEVLFDLGFIDSAKYYQDLALEIRVSGGNKEGELYSYNSLAHIALYEKQYSVALDYCNKAWAIEEQRRYGTYNQDIFHNYYEAYSGLENWKMALVYLEKYSRAKQEADSLNNASSILTMQADFDAQVVKSKFESSLLLQKLSADAAQKTAQRTRNLLLAGIGVLLIIAGLILRGLTQKRKANRTLASKNQQIELQKEIVEEKQREIVDSITYAKRIQYTLLAHDELLQDNLTDHFILFRPKDIVSGDFYWATNSTTGNGDHFYLAVCDSTGHGVPGAFMSLLNISFLNEAITEKKIVQPNLVLDHVRARLTTSVSKDGAQDGMDGTLLCIDKTNLTVRYASAYNSPLLISGGVLTELPADKMPIGKGVKDSGFTMHEIPCKKGDIIYLFTDGYADQFGGPKGKKFKYRQLHELLLANSMKPLSEQQKLLQATFDAWRGHLEQIDDVCIIGIKI